MFLNGYKKDALAMWVLGRAYEAADQRGLTADYRQMCLDRLDYMIRCMGGSSVWLVGHLGSPVGGNVAYGLAKASIVSNSCPPDIICTFWIHVSSARLAAALVAVLVIVACMIV